MVRAERDFLAGDDVLGEQAEAVAVEVGLRADAGFAAVVRGTGQIGEQRVLSRRAVFHRPAVAGDVLVSVRAADAETPPLAEAGAVLERFGVQDRKSTSQNP